MDEQPDDPVEALVARFPELFAESPVRYNSDLPSGWVPIVVSLLEDIRGLLHEAPLEQVFRILQFKEKFGGLRFYWTLQGKGQIRIDIINSPGASMTVGPDKPTALFNLIADRVAHAERQSQATCQLCARTGATLSHRGWHATMCPPCWVNFKARFREEGR